MSYIVGAIEMMNKESEDEKTEDDSFLNFLVAAMVAKEANALACRFHIEPNNTIH